MFHALVLAQVASGLLTGFVTEGAEHKPLAGVVVTMASPALPHERVVTTDASGMYWIGDLPAGFYAVTVEKEGYRPYQRGGVHFGATATHRLNVELLSMAPAATPLPIAAGPGAGPVAPGSPDICLVTPDAPECATARQLGEEAKKVLFPGFYPSPPKHGDEDPPEQVTIRSKPPPRSASDWQVEPDTIASVPHETGADVLGTLPGVYVSNRALLGQAPHLSLRGFEGTSGQDMEIIVGNVPMNQVSNIRAPGYADMRLIMPEVVRDVRISHGPYDPRQGDFAIAGSAHMDLGLDEPGFLGKATLGSFGSRRLLLAFAPNSSDDRLRESFGAVEVYSTDGVGTGRGGERSSFVGQIAFSGSQNIWRGFVAIGSARFDFPGLLDQRAVEEGQYPYSANGPLGRDLTQQAHVGNEFIWETNGGIIDLGFFLSKTKLQMHENLTGFVRDVLAGLPPTSGDDAEQVNDATTYGLNLSYRKAVDILSPNDLLEAGIQARIDSIQQTDTRLFSDGTINKRLVDASIDATNVAGYVDASVHPFRRVIVRGGTRIDSLSYSVTDHLGSEGIASTAQGVHVGNKATADYAAGAGWHLLASYGEGFRSPEARELSEGERVPFATIQSVEGGARMKQGTAQHGLQASLVGFASWLSQDRVFDPLQRENTPAPASSRFGAAGAIAVRWGVLGTSVSGTATRAVFDASDDRFREGDPVPYAPAFVLRDDAFVVAPLGMLGGRRVVGRFGVGLQGAFGAKLPGGADAKGVAYVDALASASWHDIDLALNAMNLLGLRYYDLQYLYTSNFQASPSLPAAAPRVLVAPPSSVFITLQLRLDRRPRAAED
jgi:hypothetical protein